MATRVQYKEPFDKKLRNDEFGNMASYRKHPHRGQDWSPAEKAVIPAISDAKVVNIFWSDVLGNVVEVLAADGVYTQYCHLADAPKSIKKGDLIKLGQPIGRVGGGKNTPSGSASTGAHLHMGMSKVKNGHLAPYEKLIDPLKHILANLKPVESAPAPAVAPVVAPTPAVAPVVAPAPVADAGAPTDALAELLKIDLSKKPKLAANAKSNYATYIQKKFKFKVVNGIYDDRTRKAVAKLQKKHKYIADGNLGNLTWDRIIEL